MFYKLKRHLTCSFLSYCLFFNPILASAEGDTASTAACGGGGFVVGALVTAFALIHASSNKSKATKADKYTQGNLKLFNRQDSFSHKRTTSRKIEKK